MKKIMVIAPSKSMNKLSYQTMYLAHKKLIDLNFRVEYGKNIFKQDYDYGCASIEDRIFDLHNAFKDKNTDIILTTIGGFNSNQLLPYIDYNLIKNNSKIICGFSDITALLNAIYVKSGIITYYGPHFSSFGMKYGFEYTKEYFEKILLSKEQVEVISSKQYSNDEWYKDQENRKYIKNNGMMSVNEGVAEGVIVGGNLCTFNLLQGTEFMPSLKDKILFLEDTGLLGKNFLLEFDRNLESLIQNKDFKEVKGIVIGRAEENTDMTEDKWIKMIKNKKALCNIPIIINADFGHTTPIFTFPIGGNCKIISNKKECKIIIKER